MSCQPSEKNLPLYFQSIVPSISNPQVNKIQYATTGSIPKPFNNTLDSVSYVFIK